MPYKCCVYGCKSNYDDAGKYLSMFSFPKDETLRQEWIRKIPNDFSKVTKYMRVCENHFKTEEIIRIDVIGDKKVSIQV